MPDPRLPQRPGSRPPAPQKGQDPGARLIRPLSPDQHVPPGEPERKIRKGETYWIVGCDDVPEPRKAKIIRLSNEVGKTVCVEFEEPIGGTDKEGQRWGTVHDGGGLGKMGHCLYVRPEQVVDSKTMEAYKAHAAEHGEATPTYDEYEELTVNPQPSQPGRIEVLDDDKDK